MINLSSSTSIEGLRYQSSLLRCRRVVGIYPLSSFNFYIPFSRELHVTAYTVQLYVNYLTSLKGPVLIFIYKGLDLSRFLQ